MNLLKIGIYTILLALLASCSVDETQSPHDVAPEQASTKSLKSKEPTADERPTLEDINKYLVNEGLEPISQDAIDDVLRRMREYRKKKGVTTKSNVGSCASVSTFGDWSRQKNLSRCTYYPFSSNYISSRDLAIAQRYINANSSDGTSAPSGINWNGYMYCASDNFAVISYDNLGTGHNTVDQDDKAIVTAYILGLCP